MRRAITCVAILGISLAALSVAQEPSAGQNAQRTVQHEMTPESMAKQKRAMNEMMVKMLGEKDAGYEARFIDSMIPHHEGAILMAKDALSKTSKPELKEMAQKMITEQEKEIAMLRSWRQAWYPKSNTTNSQK